MKTDELLSVENKKVVVELSNSKFVLPDDLQMKIDKYWDDILKKGEKLFRGEVFSISEIEDNVSAIRIKLSLSDFAHYLYSRRVGLPEEYACKNLHTSCLIELNDEVFVLGEMGKNTSMPGNIQCVGGGLDNDDIKGLELDLVHNIKKELMEEVGFSVDDDHALIDEFSIKYLRYDSGVHSIAAIFVLKLKISAKEFAELYEKFEAGLVLKGKLPEFEKLIYLPKNKKSIEDFYDKESKHIDHYVMPTLKRRLK